MLVQVIKEAESVIYQQRIYKHGDTLEMEDSVAASLIKRGYVAEVFEGEVKCETEAFAIAPAGEEQVAGHLDPEQLSEMSYQELKKLAKDMGVSANGTKTELVARISGTEVYVDASDLTDELPQTSMPE